MRYGLLLALFIGTAPSASRGVSVTAPGLDELFRSEIPLVAAKLKLRRADLDSDVALALAATGASWMPTAGGHALLTGDRRHLSYTSAEERKNGLAAAHSAGDVRASVSFALSLVLCPPAGDTMTWRAAMETMNTYGGGLDRVLVGILSASDSVPLLPRLTYAAADLLLLRVEPQQIPLYLALAESRDPYLRSRGIACLGLVACTESASSGGPVKGLLAPIRSFPISASQRGMFLEIVERAARDGSYRVRGAAALALGLAGDAKSREILQKLARDPAYLNLPGSSRGVRRILFPVRATTETMLVRLGYPVHPSGGEFAGRAVRSATRGGKDVTRDTRGLKRDNCTTLAIHDWGW